MSRPRPVASSITVACALALVACSSGSGNTSTGNSFTGGAGGKPTTSSGTGGVGGGGSLFDASTGSDGAGGAVGTGGAGGSYLIYASTDTDLYTLDPQSQALALTHVGTFDCVDPVNGPHKAMTDVAVDKSDHLWGITGHDVYPLTVQGSTVHCGAVTSLKPAQAGQTIPTFYALTFAPVGVVDPGVEVLVAGNSAGELWAIDAMGTASQHGVFGTVPADDGRGHAYAAANVGKPWELSGDIVFLANGGSPVGFATVRDCPSPPSTTGCSYVDTLIEIDVSKLAAAGAQQVIKAVRGQIVKRAGCNDGWSGDYGSMYGIAAWDDLVYGFSRTGNLVQISNDDGSACLVQNYSPNKFSGAAVTTLAPVHPPPPVK
jgi:hypothetical protein